MYNDLMRSYCDNLYNTIKNIIEKTLKNEKNV